MASAVHVCRDLTMPRLCPRGLFHATLNFVSGGQSRFQIVALAQLNPNTLKPPSSLIRQRRPRPVARRRVTEKDQDRMVELYQSGQDALSVAAEVGVAKSTVLRTLRARGVEVRPWGVKYWVAELAAPLRGK